MSRQTTKPGSTVQRYYIPGVTVVLLFAGLSLLAGYGIYQYERYHFKRTFGASMAMVQRDMRDLSFNYFSRLNAVAAAFTAANAISEREFSQFQIQLGRWPQALRSIAWLEREVQDGGEAGFPLRYHWGDPGLKPMLDPALPSGAFMVDMISRAELARDTVFSVYFGQDGPSRDLMVSVVPVLARDANGGLDPIAPLRGFVVGFADLGTFITKVMANAPAFIERLHISELAPVTQTPVRRYQAVRRPGGDVDFSIVPASAAYSIDDAANVMAPTPLAMPIGHWQVQGFADPSWHTDAVLRAIAGAVTVFTLLYLLFSFFRFLANGKKVLAAHVQERTQALREANENLQIQREELIQLTCELAEAKERTEEAMAARSNFMAMMGHEIRTPISGVVGMAELLERTPLNETQRGYVGTIRQSGDILLTMIRDLLDSMRLEARRLSLAREPFRVSEVVEGVAELMRPRIVAKGLRLHIGLDIAPHDRVIGDPIRLRQVLLNLVGNAAKFTSHGHIAITAAVEDDAVKDHESADDAIKLRFCVSDTGDGIPPDRLDSVFERFTQVGASQQQNAEGSGLGLAIARELVDLMGGKIWVESEFGQGTSFIFNAVFAAAEAEPALLDTAPASTPALAEIPAPASPPQRLSILLVDDNEINIKLLEAVLSDMGHLITVSQDGAAALATAMRKRFDLILMDMHMPKMDGFEATRRIRALGGEYERLPIFAVTANAIRGDRERCLEAGADDYFEKPIDFERLRARISELPGGVLRPTKAAQG